MGYSEQDRDRALREVPISVPDPEKWPEGIRQIGMSELNNLGIDRKGAFYWNGRSVKVQKLLVLSWWQKASAVIVTVTAALVALSTIIQGVAAYNEWACTVGWLAVCPAVPPVPM